jgi:hypothetical protein
MEGTSEVELDLPANGSVFVVFRKPKLPVSQRPAITATQPVDGPWTLEFPAAKLTQPVLASWTQNPDPSIRYFAGTVKYRKTITVPAGWKNVRLDLGRLWMIAQVRLNGKPLGIVWTPPYVVDVTPALREGPNELEIDVTNTWLNRLIGDAKLPKDQRTTRTNVTTSGGKPFGALDPIDSGLLGPVQLQRLE